MCCPLPPVCQPKPRMKHLAGKHIPCPVAAMGWSGADAGGRGEAAESSRTRSAFPRFLPASGAERGPAFPLPSPLALSLPSARLQARRKHILKEDPVPGTWLQEDPVWENLIIRLEKTEACFPLALSALPDATLLL